MKFGLIFSLRNRPDFQKICSQINNIFSENLRHRAMRIVGGGWRHRFLCRHHHFPLRDKVRRERCARNHDRSR